MNVLLVLLAISGLSFLVSNSAGEQHGVDLDLILGGLAVIVGVLVPLYIAYWHKLLLPHYSKIRTKLNLARWRLNRRAKKEEEHRRFIESFRNPTDPTDRIISIIHPTPSPLNEINPIRYVTGFLVQSPPGMNPIPTKEEIESAIGDVASREASEGWYRHELEKFDRLIDKAKSTVECVLVCESLLDSKDNVGFYANPSILPSEREAFKETVQTRLDWYKRILHLESGDNSID